MTRQLKIANAGTAFGKWFRNTLRDSHTGLVIIDLDTVIYLFYDYQTGRLMIIEEKANGDELSYAQAQTFKMLDKALKIGCEAIGVDYRGIHVVKMDGSDPDKSRTIRFDGTVIDKDNLINTLNMTAS